MSGFTWFFNILRSFSISLYEILLINDLLKISFRFEVIKLDYLILMGCGDECPNLVADERIEWDIPDPKDMEKSEFLKVIEKIRCEVQKLIGTIYIEHSL